MVKEDRDETNSSSKGATQMTKGNVHVVVDAPARARRTPLIPLLLTVATAIPSIVSQHPAHAGIVANFTDGNDVNNGGSIAPTPDSFTGTAGNGWTGAWATGSTQGNLVAGVLSTTPLNGGGNYLGATVTATSFAGQADVYRSYTSTGDLQTTGPYTIQFDFRVDETSSHYASNFTNRFDVYAFGGASNGTKLDEGTGGAFETWRIDFFGATAFGVARGHFGFEDGDRTGSTTVSGLQNDIDSGLMVIPGTTYHFTINIDPATRSWQGSVTDGTLSYTSGILGFRSSEFDSLAIWFNGRADVSGETRAFAVDSIRISAAVPEPSSWNLLGSGLASHVGLWVLRQVRGGPRGHCSYLSSTA
jgi:hypothetical protein